MKAYTLVFIDLDETLLDFCKAEKQVLMNSFLALANVTE